MPVCCTTLLASATCGPVFIMRDDQAFNIKFVQAIENYPILYNSTLTDYSNKQVTAHAWTEIAATFMESVEACREKWKILRGGYTRFLKKRSSMENAGNSIKPYYLAKYMTFLLPYLKSKTRLNNFENDKAINVFSDEENLMENASTDDLGATQTILEERTTDSPVTRKLIQTYQRPAKHKMPDSLDKSIIDYIETKKRKMEDDLENPDAQFLRSLLPDMKLLQRSKKNIFKIEVLRTLNALLWSDDSPAPSLPADMQITNVSGSSYRDAENSNSNF